jgi:C1A family cysteine protease
MLYQRVGQDATSMKSAIAAGLGIVLGISVYASFESDTVATSGVVPLPGKCESLLGGHCVYICGFTDVALPDIPAQYFIGRNPWGVGWGLKGYFAIPYAYLLNPNLCGDLWVIQKVA